MADRFTEARYAIEQARAALKRGERGEARRLAEHATSLAPHLEDPWLVLAVVASPQASVNYVKKALDINPNSLRARNAMQWAMQRLQETPERHDKSNNIEPVNSPESSGRRRRKRRSAIYPVLLFALGCIVLVFAAWSASTSPALASILNFRAPRQAASVQHPRSWAHVEIAKPTYTPAVPSADVVMAQPTAALFIQNPAVDIGPSVDVEAGEPTATQFIEPSAETSVPEATEIPGTMYAEIIPDTPTPEYVPPADAPFVPTPAIPQVANAASYDGEHWIDVDLTQQRVYAYAGDTVVNSFLVSTGTWQTPTVTGKYKVWIKLRSTDMSGPGYYLPDVPYTMYFYKGYGLHGTYWHNNFGTPMSHGCVNLSIPDAAWLYDFSYVGTTVNVHY